MVVQATSALKREAYPHDVVFVEEDDTLWLRGRDLSKAKGVLGFCNDGQESIGFDGETASYYLRALLEQGLTVGVARGNEVKTITLQGHKDPAKVVSTVIAIAPVLLYGQREMARLVRHHTRKYAPMAAPVERFRQELVRGNEGALRDVGQLFIVQVGLEMYDYDWSLVTMPQDVVDALAVAAHLEGKKLRCQLVEPKGRRSKKGRAVKPAIVVSEPVTYGQLRLGL